VARGADDDTVNASDAVLAGGTMKRVTLLLVIPAAVALIAACENPTSPLVATASASELSPQFDLVDGEVLGATGPGQADAGASAATHVPCTVDKFGSKGTGIFVLTSSGHFTLVCHAEAGKLPIDQPTVTHLPICRSPEIKGSGSGHVTVTPSGNVTLVCTGQIGVKEL
jgi:hypothetical protein